MAVVGVVDADIVDVVGGVGVRKGRSCFLDLPLPHPELGPHPTISDLYNIYKIENIRHILTK